MLSLSFSSSFFPFPLSSTHTHALTHPHTKDTHSHSLSLSVKWMNCKMGVCFDLIWFECRRSETEKNGRIVSTLVVVMPRFFLSSGTATHSAQRRPAAARLPDLPHPPNEETFFLSRTKANDSKQHQTQVSQRLNCSMIKTITRIRPLKPFQRGVPESEGTILFLALPRFSLSPPSSSPSLSLSLYLSLSPSLSRKEMKLVSGLSDVTLRESWVTIFSESRLKMFSLKILFGRFWVWLRWTARVGSIKTLLRLC